MYSAMECDAKDMTDFFLVSGNREPLRLYGKLLPAQRRALLNGAQIPTRSLYPYQQEAVLRIGRTKGQSMFAAFGGKPERQPEQLAAAILTLEVQGGGNQPLRNPGAGAPGAVGGMVPQAMTMHILRLTFPDGQKDEFQIPLSRAAGPGGPGAAAPGQAPPPPVLAPTKVEPENPPK
jgi:hypothetical protein